MDFLRRWALAVGARVRGPNSTSRGPEMLSYKNISNGKATRFCGWILVSMGLLLWGALVALKPQG